jgi:hypothetical protein
MKLNQLTENIWDTDSPLPDEDEFREISTVAECDNCHEEFPLNEIRLCDRCNDIRFCIECAQSFGWMTDVVTDIDPTNPDETEYVYFRGAACAACYNKPIQW